MGYRLGVDLGTTYTAAAVRNGERDELFPLGDRGLEVPSVVLLREDGEFLVGDAAERRGLVAPQRLAREFKRRIGDTTPLRLGGTPFSAQALTSVLLRWVVDRVQQREGGPPDEVVLTHPANWGQFKRDTLRHAAELADLPDVVLTSEPEAAALRYAMQERRQVGDVVAVYDLGGGTFDTTVLSRTESGFEVLGVPAGIEQLGGVDFDDALFHHVLEALGADAEELDAEDEEVVAGVARLRRDCVTAKEALTQDTEIVLPVTLPGLHRQVRVTRAEFEDMIRPSLRDTISALQRALRSARVTPDRLSAVLLAGGSSRIPLVAEIVAAELGRPVALDAHPKHLVALGAACHGATAERTLVTVPTVTGDLTTGVTRDLSTGVTRDLSTGATRDLSTGVRATPVVPDQPVPLPLPPAPGQPEADLADAGTSENAAADAGTSEGADGDGPGGTDRHQHATTPPDRARPDTPTPDAPVGLPRQRASRESEPGPVRGAAAAAARAPAQAPAPAARARDLDMPDREVEPRPPRRDAPRSGLLDRTPSRRRRLVLLAGLAAFAVVGTGAVALSRTGGDPAPTGATPGGCVAAPDPAVTAVLTTASPRDRGDLFHIWGGAVHTWIPGVDGTLQVTSSQAPDICYPYDAGRWGRSDVNGDAVPDLVHITDGGVRSWVAKGDGTFSVVPVLSPQADYPYGSGAWVVADVSGDGATDLAHATAAGVTTWVSTGTGDFTVSAQQAAPGADAGRWDSGDIDGDGDGDLVHVTDVGIESWIRAGDGQYAVAVTQPPRPDYPLLQGTWHVADVNGDRRDDVVRVGDATVDTWVARADARFAPQYSPVDPSSGHDLQAGRFLTGDVDADGVDELVHSYVVGANVWRREPGGRYSIDGPNDFEEPRREVPMHWRTGDVDGDSRTELLHVWEGGVDTYSWTVGSNWARATATAWDDYAFWRGLWVLGS